MVSESLTSEYPFIGKRCAIGDLSYHYLDEGSGPPVVMVHGNPSWSFYYRNLVLALRDRYRCIVPDHMGCGFSDKPDDDRYEYTLSRRVDDLEYLLEQLAITDSITLVVHDWGGMIGMAYASRHPERIVRLVILNTGAFHLPTAKPLPLGLRICRDTFLGTLLVRGCNAFSVGASHVGCKRHPMNGTLRSLYQLPYDSWKNRIATLRFVQDIPLSPGDKGYELVSTVAAALPRFRSLPILILWGELDFVFDHHFRAEWQKLYPEAELHQFADCGHYILEDAPEEVIPLISSFLGRSSLTP